MDSRTITYQMPEEKGGASVQLHGNFSVPPVGAEVSFWSTRDGKGDYVHKHGESQFEGRVKSVKIDINERGSSPRTHEMLEFVTVTLE